MHIRSNNQYNIVSGVYKTIRLEVTPVFPPLTEAERSKTSANYPTELACLNVYLDEEKVADSVPPAYIMFLLDHLLSRMHNLHLGESITAEWFSDPWQFTLVPYTEEQQLSITLHIPNKWVAIKNVKVPLKQFTREVGRVAERWRKYILLHYRSEVSDAKMGEHFRRFEEHLKKQSQAD